MIEVRGVTKVFGEKVAVRDVSFTVEPGVVTALLGPNGAGKTTTLRILLGLARATSGTATVDGVEYRTMRRPLTRVGSLLDPGWVHPRRRAAAHLRWLASSNGLPASRVAEVLARVGLEDAGRMPCGDLSLGMRQRLGLAAALLGDPRHLVLDEPVNGLDPEGIVWMRSLLRAMAEEGRSVLLSSHLLGEVAQTADQVIVLARGEVRFTGSVSDFTARAGGSRVVVRVSDPDGLCAALAREGIDRVHRRDGDEGPELLVEGVRARQIGEIAAMVGVAVFGMTEESSSLEDAFMTEVNDSVEYRGKI